MDATISVVCYKSKTLSNGEHPLMLRISKDGKKKYQSLGISVNPKFWDFQKNKPKPKCPNLEYLQKIILDKKLELQKKKLEIKSDQKEYSAATLLEANANLLVAKTVDCFYKEIIAQCEINNKCGNRLVYLNSYNSLKRFTNGKLEIPFNSINVAWLEKYEKWLRSNGNKETTISLMFRTLRSTYNKAIKERCAHLSDYPFQEYKISKFDTSTQKRAIAKTDMLKFTETSQPIGQKKYVELSKDIFIFSYLCGGINFTDIANLTQENIVNGRLHYIRQKTGKLIKIGIPQEAMQIIKKYTERDLLLIQTIEYMAGVILLCLLLCLFTVWRMKHASIQSSIYKNKSKRHKQKIRNCLLGIQFFICWLFIVFTVALYLQANKTGSTLFNTLTEKEKSEIISIPMDYRFMKNDEKLALIERISQHPDIKDKMLTDINYLKGISGTSMQTEKDNRESSLEVNIMNVPNNFFEFMNIPILSGHVLKTNSDMVADRKLVERIKKDLLGTTLYNYQDSYTVCGICSDFVADTYNQSQGFVFLPCDFKYYVGHCYLKCVPGKAEEVEAFVKKMLEENLPPSIQLHISTLQEDIHQAQAIENNMKGIILFFSFVSLIITLLGVYSAITLDTERRQKEVAIRKVNGAGLKQIIILFARTYIYQLVLSATMAFPLCYAILQLWKNMYIVFFNDGPLFWISIFIIVAVITTLTIIFRILKIARTNPAEVIKNE